jgi:sulfite reductase alpha subunit-like flavoprotein
VSVQPVSVVQDADLGRTIRELWQAGQMVVVLPRNDERIVLALMDFYPAEDDFTVIDEVVPATGSFAKSEGA